MNTAIDTAAREREEALLGHDRLRPIDQCKSPARRSAHAVSVWSVLDADAECGRAAHPAGWRVKREALALVQHGCELTVERVVGACAGRSMAL